VKTEMVHDRIADKGIVMARRVRRQGWLTVPGIGVALLPKLACPLCWPIYSGIVSSVGLGLLVSTRYLLHLTVALLILTAGVLAYHAKQRRRYGPFLLGIAGAAAVLIGKFHLESNPVTFTGIVVVVVASAWNLWPLPAVESCSCHSKNGNAKTRVLHRGSTILAPFPPRVPALPRAQAGLELPNQNRNLTSLKAPSRNRAISSINGVPHGYKFW
jgi:hypothetical protein